MSGLDLLNPRTASGAGKDPMLERTNVFQTLGAQAVSTFTSISSAPEEIIIGDKLRERDQKLRERFGKDIYDLTGTTAFSSPAYINPVGGAEKQRDDARSRVDDIINKGRKDAPDQWKDIPTTAEIRQPYIDLVNHLEHEASRVAAQNPSNTSRIVGTLGGSLTGAIADPINIATMPLGAGELKVGKAGALAYASAIGKAALKEAGIQMGVNTAQLPSYMAYQERLGREYGASEIARDYLYTAGGAALLRGASDAIPAIAKATPDALRGGLNASKRITVGLMDKVLKRTPDIPQTAKDALKYVERVADIDEGAPTPLRTNAELGEHRKTFDSVADDIESYTPPKAAPYTGIVKTVTPRNELEIEAKVRVVDLQDLITSDMKDYNQSLQPRDRANRVSSDARINEIAANIDPAQLHDSRVSSTGAPIVGGDMMVESGNGRVMALKKAYEAHPESAKRYRDYLEAQGFNTQGMERPVLIRQRLTQLTDAERKNFVIYSNEDVADRFSATERALADAKLLNDNMVSQYKGGDFSNVSNAGFVRQFSELAVSPADRNAFMTSTGALSQDGIKRIRAAMLARAYGDVDIVQRLMEDMDNNIKTIGNVLMDMAGEWSKMRSAVNAGFVPMSLDITDDVMAAVRTVMAARDTNRPISDWINQISLFDETSLSPEAIAILRAMYKPELTQATGAAKLADFFDFYMKQAAEAQPGKNLFGQEPPTALEILNAGLDRLHGKGAVRTDGGEGKIARAYLKDPEVAKLEPQQAINLARMYETAQNSFKRFSDDINGIADAVGGRADVGKLKGTRRAVEKILSDYAGDATKIKDLLRATVVVKTLDDANAAIKNIMDKFEIVGEPRNMLDPAIDAPLGYRDAKFNVRVNGIVAEVQVNLPEMIEAKKDLHRWYEDLSALDRKKASGVPLTEREIQQYDSLKKTMKDGYDAVWADAVNRLNSASEIGMPSSMTLRNPPGSATNLPSTNAAARLGTSDAGSSLTGMPSTLKKSTDISAPLSNNNISNAMTTVKEPVIDYNAYALSEYRAPKLAERIEVEPSNRLASMKAEIDSLVKADPNMKIALEDGTVLNLVDYVARIKEDEKVIEAITTCRLQ